MTNIVNYVKRISLFAIISSSVLLFPTCSDSDNNHSDDKHPVLKEGEGWFSFAVNMHQNTSFESRTYATEPTNNTAQNEIKVSNARIIFYNSNTNLASEVFDYVLSSDFEQQKITGNNILQSSGLDKFTVKPIPLKSMKYNIVAIINPSEKIKEITEKGKNYTELVSAIDIDMSDIIGKNKDEFVMMNTSGPVFCDEKCFYPTYKQAEEDSNNTRPKIYVERLAAKIMFKVSNSVPNQKIISENGKTYTLDIANLKWTLDVVNKKIYPMRKFTYKKGGKDTAKPNDNMEQESDYQKMLSDGVTSMREILYAEDPNFKDFNFPNKTQTDLSKEFTYIKDLDTAGNPINWKNKDETIYASENTMDNDTDFKMNVTSHIVLRIPCTVVPNDGTTFLYYRTSIRHFDINVEQDIKFDPTNDDETNPGGTTEGSGGFVGGTLRNWGAYGVVRNNSYILTLNSISSVKNTTNNLNYPADIGNY